MADSNRWLVRDARRLPVGTVAAETLRNRLDAVWTELRAACASPDQAEHVHQLRVATRRALAAFDAFHGVIPAKRRDWFKHRLRRLRRSAGEARDLDVLTDRLSCEPATRAHGRLIAMLARQRLTSRQPIRAELERLGDEDWPTRVDRLITVVDGRRRHASFRAFARRRLRPLVASFFEQADRRLRDRDELHTLRIAGKKLRYALEIFATALPARARTRCAGALEQLQKTLGQFTDHAAAADRLQRWASSTDAGPNHDLLVALCDQERTKASAARKTFSKWWNPARRRSLRRRFTHTLRRSA